MRKILIGLFFLLFTIPFYSQNQQANLNKYWTYRNRLRDSFMVVSPNVMDYGVNIPASEIFYNNPSVTSSNRISWGDGNCNMSQYLSVLATELWILKNNGQDYSTTLKELFYAMMALERLDKLSEANLRWYKTTFATLNKNEFIDAPEISWQDFIDGDINGFSLRDDVSPGFWSNNSSQFNQFDVGICDGHLIFNAGRDADKGKCVFMEENSQDVIEHDMMGLGLVSKLVGTESIDNVPCEGMDTYIQAYLINQGIMNGYYSNPQTINFSLWAKDIVKRYITYMQSHGEYGETTLWGVSTYLSTHWVLINPVTNVAVQQGNGKDFGVALMSPGLIQAGQAITGENLTKYDSFDQGSAASLVDGNFNNFFQFPGTGLGILVDFAIPSLKYNDELTRTVSCIGNVMGNNTFSTLRNLRDTYNPNSAPTATIYEHLPLINLAMFDPDYHIMGVEDAVYNYDKGIYEGLLNSAPSTGPASNCGVTDWTSESRCLWPQQLGLSMDKYPDQVIGTTTSAGSYVAFNGLDYMMLHNLYYIAFRKEDFKTLNITNNHSSIDNRQNSQYSGNIIAGCSILGNNVTYRARKQIKLVPGFSATSLGGKTFAATIGPRANNYDGTAYVKTEESHPLVTQAMVHKSYVYTGNTSVSTLTDDPSIITTASIYPNPCRGKLEITLNNSDFPIGYSITSSNGVVVNNGQITSNHQILELSVLPKGVYFISLYLKDKTETKKIILI